MLNYDIHTGEREIELLESEVRGIGVTGNPFPGLRPFGIDECHLFFGREGQVDEVLMKLSQNRFAAIMGFSGSGKSSLMYCGLIPVLYGGFMTHAGPNWNIVVTRPGISPIDNLAESILKAGSEFQTLSEEDKLIRHTVTSSILRSGVKGLVDVAKNLKEESGENLLILVDQFEELFRFSENEQDQIGSNEPVLFINMLLEAIKQDDVPIYLAITMRSEFIGECAKYPGLTEMINMSNYLVPLMTREQKRMAIEGPVAVGGGKISQTLVKKLLNDLGDQQDQLPILQHALMRSWNYWVENREEDEPLDTRHYNAIGKITEALSLHANEAYDELDDRQKQICEALFKTITEKSNENVGIRRPSRLYEIAEIAGGDEEEVIKVIDHFRISERSLLMPPANIPLESDSIVEISHESLIRIWVRLKSWVEEENESARMYKRISEAAAMYQVGRTGLWRPPDLQLALNWQKKQNPTRIWAQRYDEAFERAIVFLDTSRITYEAEQKNQELLQKRLLKRAKNVALMFGVAAVVLIILFLFGLQQRFSAEAGELAATNARIEAERLQVVAQNQRDIAATQFKEAQKQVVRAKIQAQKALGSKMWADYQAQQANNALLLAQLNEDRAIAAQKQTEIALEGQTIATANEREARQEAEAGRLEIDKLLHLSASQSMAVKSGNLRDRNLQGLLAQQAFIFNRDYDGNPYDPYIYEGLYGAMKEFNGSNYNEFSGHVGSVRAVAFSPDEFKFYSAGGDGSVRQWDPGTGNDSKVLIANGKFPNRVVKISPNGQWLAVGSDSTTIQLINLKNQGDPKEISGHKGFVYDIVFKNDNSGFYSLSYDQTLRYSNFRSSSLIKRLETPLKSIAISPDDSYLVGASVKGKIIRISTSSWNEEILYEEAGNRFHSVEISPDGKTLAFGDNKGQAHIWDIKLNKEINLLHGHTAMINDIEFSPDSKMIATGSNDGSIQLYLMQNLDDLPIVMRDHKEFVRDLSFSNDGRFIIAATQSDIIKIWPTQANFFAKDLCANLTGDITKQDWTRYVPNGVDYETTCSSYDKGGGGE